jgi:alpha-tubulin suppressor-like RCC1 family protein
MLAIKTDGTLWAWGNNGNGQLGQNNKQLFITSSNTWYYMGYSYYVVSHLR